MANSISLETKKGQICCIEATNRQVLVDRINWFIDVFAPNSIAKGMYLRVELLGKPLGCNGMKVDYAIEADVPYHSVPCSCGNPDHWLIKYEEN